MGASGKHLAAFAKGQPQLSWGHLFFADNSAMETANVRKILLVRDPYSWVIARARFFLSEEFSGNVDRLKEGLLTVEELLNLMIFGIYQKAPPMLDVFTHNAVAWLGTDVHLVRYEDLVHNLKKIERAFRRILLHRPIRCLRDRYARGLARARADRLRPQAKRHRAREFDGP